MPHASPLNAIVAQLRIFAGSREPVARRPVSPTSMIRAGPAQSRSNGARDAVSPLTDVTLVWREGVHEDWLKFGRPLTERIVSRSRRIESYAAGQVFALVRWASSDFGTIRSTLAVVRAVAAGQPCTPVARVHPGGQLLLFARGWSKVAQVFRLIDAIEASGIDPCEVAPEHWRHVHNRLAGGEHPACYTPAQHRAWLRRKALGA